AADTGRVVAGMQLVQRRWDGKDGLVLRLACSGEPPEGLTGHFVEAVHEARPMYPEYAAKGFIHPLSVEWVRPADLVTNPRTGKLVPLVDERSHD
ncbi:hypothetical protein ACFQ08_30890, partial [Streptosporangium algeriense]